MEQKRRCHQVGVSFKILSMLVMCMFFLASGCSLESLKPHPPQRKTEQKKTQSVEKTRKNNQKLQKLVEENEKLKARLVEIERQSEMDKQLYQEKLKKMDQTIALMEKNIQDFETKYSDQPITLPQQKQPKKKVEKSKPAPKSASLPAKKSPSGEIPTPSGSKAIETVDLLPPAPAVRPVAPPKIQKQKEPEQKLEVPKPIPVIESKESWEDPDLRESLSPIHLQVYPGAKAMYDKAFKTYSMRSFDLAIEQFEEFLGRFPNDQNADNSQFWIGQAYYYQKKWNQSEVSFRKVLRNYKHGETKRGYKTPDAILMLGKIYIKKKKPIRARYYFRHVISRFGDSRSAAKAQKEIESLNSL